MKNYVTFPYGSLDEAGRVVVEDVWRLQPTWAVASISPYDAAFFAGLVIAVRPRKLLEVGVASGWGSCILLKALERADLPEARLHGVDIAERFFCDSAYATGECVREVFPSLLPRYHLITGEAIGSCIASIGAGIDFAFIDAHHMHPWATLDMLAILPFVEPESWVALHDLGLSLREDEAHRNRGPKYLFEGWNGARVHSIQEPTMAGAVRVAGDAESHLPALLDILHTPWELQVEDRHVESVCDIVAQHFGESWSTKFRRAAEVGNRDVSEVHSPELEQLRQENARLKTELRDSRRRRTFLDRLLDV